MPDSPRILVIRFSSIGDILLTTPLLRAVRARYPEAHLAFLTKEAFAPLLKDNPRLSAMHALAPAQPLRDLAATLRREHFTHILDLQGSLRTRDLRIRVRARWSGYRHHRLARSILIRFKKNLYPRELPVPERYFDAARRLGVKPDGGPPEFFLAPEAGAEVETWLAARGLSAADGIIALAPSAAHNTKRWPVESWRDLIDRISRTGDPVVIVGGPGDEAIAEDVARGRPGRVFKAAGAFGLQGTGALLARSRLLISGDTGVMHMATGVGTPVVALFGPTVRAFGFFPYVSRAVVLERDLECRPCTRFGSEQCPLGHHRCLRDIGAQEVEDVMRRMIG